MDFHYSMPSYDHKLKINLFETRYNLYEISYMNKQKIRIFPSILSGDYGYLATEAKKIEEAGADGIHIDIMDGHFVRNLAFSPKAVAAINRATDLFLDVHIMVYNPFDYIEELITAGADSITFHFEATEDVADILQYIHKCNIKAGLAFSPSTSISMIPQYLPLCDHVLLMTVDPGFGGQSFLPQVLEKITFVRDFCNKHSIYGRQNKISKPTKKQMSQVPFIIQVDGGINQKTGAQCIAAGANVLIAGSYLFEGDMQHKITKLKELSL